MSVRLHRHAALDLPIAEIVESVQDTLTREQWVSDRPASASGDKNSSTPLRTSHILRGTQTCDQTTVSGTVLIPTNASVHPPPVSPPGMVFDAKTPDHRRQEPGLACIAEAG